MKKILFAFVCALALFATACTSCHHDTPEPAAFNFEQTLANDMDSVIAMFPEAVFYESEIEFAAPLSDTAAYKIHSLLNVFQCKDTCIRISYDENYNRTIELINDYWLEDMPACAYVSITLDSAIAIAKDNLGKMPNTRFVTLRRPLAPPFPECASYIFGRGLIFVDACDGTVNFYEENTEKVDSTATE